MSKRIAAVAMSSRIGESFDAIVTGVTSQEQCLRTRQSSVTVLF
jgi:exoribonuclease R